MKLTQRQCTQVEGECTMNVVETAIRVPIIEEFRESTSDSPLNNSELFIRDNYTCMYCGERQTPSTLTRDYVEPLAENGVSRWANVVTACQTCNRKKAGKNLSATNLVLLAVPFAPSLAEHRILAGRKVIVNQMNFVGRSKSSNQRVVQTQRRNCYA